MRRREFIAVSAAVIVAPPRSRAQGKPRRIGYLGVTPPLSDPVSKRNRAAFLEGLRQYGWVEGQNLLIEGRWVEGQTERYGPYAAELVSRGDIELIVAVGTQATIEAKTRTTTIPILMLCVSHPWVQASLPRSRAPAATSPALRSSWATLRRASSFCANWCRTCTAFSCYINPTTQGHDWALRPGPTWRRASASTCRRRHFRRTATFSPPSRASPRIYRRHYTCTRFPLPFGAGERSPHLPRRTTCRPSVTRTCLPATNCAYLTDLTVQRLISAPAFTSIVYSAG